MKMSRWLMVAALGMLSCTWAHADNVPGHYDLILTGWDANQFFDALPFSDPDPNAQDAFGGQGFNTSQFTNPDDFCAGFTDCIDPGFKFNGAGNSTPENGPFNFTTGDNGTETLGFQNTGEPIFEVLFELTDSQGNPIPLPDDQLGQVFQCSSDIFQNCGFTNDGFAVAFWSPIDGPIPSTVPEPSEWAVLSLAFVGLIVARMRKGSASSAFSQTPR